MQLGILFKPINEIWIIHEIINFFKFFFTQIKCFNCLMKFLQSSIHPTLNLNPFKESFARCSIWSEVVTFLTH
ncbi:hypothetical protein J2129_000822 [Methanofollis sp. W23]|nr:hypothetical protein [Methanofollis sp. W23]